MAYLPSAEFFNRCPTFQGLTLEEAQEKFERDLKHSFKPLGTDTARLTKDDLVIAYGGRKQAKGQITSLDGKPMQDTGLRFKGEGEILPDREHKEVRIARLHTNPWPARPEDMGSLIHEAFEKAVSEQSEQLIQALLFGAFGSEKDLDGLTTGSGESDVTFADFEKQMTEYCMLDLEASERALNKCSSEEYMSRIWDGGFDFTEEAEQTPEERLEQAEQATRDVGISPYPDGLEDPMSAIRNLCR